MKIFFTNVGINKGSKLFKTSSPIYSNGSFDFIPIPTDRIENRHTYRELGFESAFRRMNRVDKLDLHAHNDPEFRTFTFGTFPEHNSNVSNLKNIELGDLLFFIASLQPTYHEKLPNQFPDWITSPRGMYLIGFFHIIGNLSEESQIGNLDEDEYKENEHFGEEIDGWIFKGSKHSSLFPVPVPIFPEDIQFLTQEECEIKQTQTDTGFVNSKTRTSREIPNIIYLINLINKYCPSAIDSFNSLVNGE